MQTFCNEGLKRIGCLNQCLRLRDSGWVIISHDKSGAVNSPCYFCRRDNITCTSTSSGIVTSAILGCICSCSSQEGRRLQERHIEALTQARVGCQLCCQLAERHVAASTRARVERQLAEHRVPASMRSRVARQLAMLRCV